MNPNQWASGLFFALLVGSSLAQPKEATCDRFHFRCASGSCVKREKLCDGRFDCGTTDVSDESSCGESTCPHVVEISKCQAAFMAQSSFRVSDWVDLNFSSAFRLASWKQLGDSCPAYKSYGTCVQPFSRVEKCAKHLAVNSMLKSIFSHFCDNFMSLQAMSAVGCVETLDNTTEVAECVAQSQLVPPLSHEDSDSTPSGKICASAMGFERFLACLAPSVHKSCGASAELFLKRFAERLENDTAADCASLKLLQSAQKKCGETEKRRYGECLTSLDHLSSQLDTFHFSNPLALASDPHNLSVTCDFYKQYHDCMESVKFCFERDSTLMFMKASVGLMCNPDTTKAVLKFQSNTACVARVSDNVPMQVCLSNFSDVFDGAVNDITVNSDSSWGSFCQAVAALINFASCSEPLLLLECANDTTHLAESILDYATKIGTEDGCVAEGQNERVDLRLPDWIPQVRTAPNCTALETNLLFSCFAPFSGLMHNSTSFNWSSFSQLERTALLGQACSAYVLYESCRKAVMGDTQCQLAQDEFRSPGGAKVFSHNFIRRTFGDECQQRLLPTTDQLCLDALPKVSEADVCVSETADFFSQFAQRAPEFNFGDPETCYTSLGLIKLSSCLGRIANETCRSPVVPQILFAHENIYREALKHCKPLTRMKELITATVCPPTIVHRCSSDLSKIATKIINDSGPPLSLTLGLAGHVQSCAAFRKYQNCTTAATSEQNCRIVWPVHSFLLELEKFLCDLGLPKLDSSAKHCLTDLVGDLSFRPCSVGLWNLLARRFDLLMKADSFALFCDLLQTFADFLHCSKRPTTEACGHQLDRLRKDFVNLIKASEINGGCILSNSTIRIGASIPIVRVEAAPVDNSTSESIKAVGLPIVRIEPLSQHKPATAVPTLTTEIVTATPFHLELPPPDIFGLEATTQPTPGAPLVFDLVVTAKMGETGHSTTGATEVTTIDSLDLTVSTQSSPKTKQKTIKSTTRRTTTLITTESPAETTELIESPSLTTDFSTIEDVTTAESTAPSRRKFIIQMGSGVPTTFDTTTLPEIELEQESTRQMLTTENFDFTDEPETSIRRVTNPHRYITKNPETLVIFYGDQVKLKSDMTIHRYLIDMHLPLVVWDESLGDPNAEKRKDLTQKVTTNLKTGLARKLPGLRHLRVVAITEGVKVTLEVDAIRHNSTTILQAIRDQLVLQSGKIGDVTVDGVTVAELVEETQIFSAECGDAQRERSTECMEPLNGFVTEITATLADVWDKDQKQKVARLINRTCTNYENAMVCAKPHLKPPCTSGNCYVKVLGAMCVEKRKIYGNLDCVGRVLSSLNVTSCLNPQTTASNLMELLTEPQKLRQYAGRLNFCLIEPLVENCGQTGANIVNKLLLLAQKFPNNTECQLTPATSAAELHETPSHRARPSEPRQQIVLSAKPVGETPQNPLQPVAEPAKLPNVTATTSSLPQGRTANNSTVKSGAVGISRISSLSCLLTAIIGIVRLTS